MSYVYVEEVKQSRWDKYKDEVSKIEKHGRKVTRSRFERLTAAADRHYAERFASLVCKRFRPEKAKYKTGLIGGRKAVVMFFSDRGWLFAEPQPPVHRVPLSESKPDHAMGPISVAD